MSWLNADDEWDRASLTEHSDAEVSEDEGTTPHVSPQDAEHNHEILFSSEPVEEASLEPGTLLFRVTQHDLDNMSNIKGAASLYVFATNHNGSIKIVNLRDTRCLICARDLGNHNPHRRTCETCGFVSFCESCRNDFMYLHDGDKCFAYQVAKIETESKEIAIAQEGVEEGDLLIYFNTCVL